MYKLITVSGPDAIEFLQGQLTQDVSLLPDSDGLLAAWCNAKGRVIVIIRLVKIDQAIGLLVPAGMATQVMQRLNMYRFRSKVDFGEPSDSWTGLIDSSLANPVEMIRAGVPTIDESNTESYTPHMLNLDKLGAISFSKGCYTGQEVVARTEHLGKSKRRLMRYEASSDSIAVGDKLSDGQREVGTVVNVLDKDLLAVTPVDLHEQVLMIGDVSLRPRELPY